MMRTMFAATVLNEARLRLRRSSTHAVLLVAALVMWFMIADPAKGSTLMVANNARVAYTSTCLALGSSMLATILLSLFGFYLARGRVAEDLRSGMGSVLAATPASNTSLILGRWAGAVLYLSTLVALLALAMIALQAVRGDGAIEPGVFLTFYALTILPNIFFIAAMAVLCESVPALIGKAGDVLYFVFWLAQIVAPAALMSASADSVALLAFDTTGLGVLMQRAQSLLQTSATAVGLTPFDPTLAPVVISADFWHWHMAATRVAAALLAVIPLALATALFHRFSPDRVTLWTSPKRWALGAAVNRMLGPLAVVSRLLLRAAPRLPPVLRPTVAELALTFAGNRVAAPLLLVFIGAGATVDYAMLPWVLLPAVLYWGVMIADVSVRDFSADTENMIAAASGGTVARYWRQGALVLLLGILLTAPIIVRFAVTEPIRALALLAGLVTLTGAAQLLGTATRSARAFTVLFLFGLYIASQSPGVAALDVIGMHGVANMVSISVQLAAALAMLWAGLGYVRWRQGWRRTSWSA